MSTKVKVFKIDKDRIGSFMSEYGSSYASTSNSTWFWDDFYSYFSEKMCRRQDFSWYAKEPEYDSNGDKLPMRIIYPCPTEEELLKFNIEDYLSGCDGDEVKQKLKSVPQAFGIEPKEFYECPTLDNGYKIWWGKRAFGKPYIYFDYGWVDGIKDKPSNFALGMDGMQHAITNGGTGSGKSVAMNNIIINIMCRYSPWDVEMYMSDAKISEYGLYSQSFQSSHIRGIAAAKDQSYAVSMLREVVRRMELRMTLFGKYKCKNIDTFIKNTNLCMPHILIFCEEYQSMIKYSTPSEAKEVADLWFKIVSLGRSAGVHMTLVSQSLLSGIPDKPTLAQIGLRNALKLDTDQASMLLLGNPSATKISKRGIMYVNANSASGDPNKDTHFKSPYIPDDRFVEMGEMMKNACRKYGAKLRLDYMYEPDRYTIREHRRSLENLPKDPNVIYLGRSAEYTTKENKLYQIHFQNKPGQHLYVCASDLRGLTRQWRLLKDNFDRFEQGTVSKKNQNNVNLFYVNTGDEGINKMVQTDKSMFPVMPCKFAKSQVFSTVVNAPYVLYLLEKIDELAFSNKVDDDVHHFNYKNVKELSRLNMSSASDKKQIDGFYNDLENMYSNLYKDFKNVYECRMSRSLFRKRLNAFFDIYLSPDVLEAYFGRDTFIKDFGMMNQLALKFLNIYFFVNQYSIKDLDLCITKDLLPITYIVICGMDTLGGIQAGKIESRIVTNLTNAMDICSEVNIRYIFLSTTYNEAKTLTKACEYTLMANVPEAQMSKYKSGVEMIGVPDTYGSVIVHSTAKQYKYVTEFIDTNMEFNIEEYI